MKLADIGTKIQAMKPSVQLKKDYFGELPCLAGLLEQAFDTNAISLADVSVGQDGLSFCGTADTLSLFGITVAGAGVTFSFSEDELYGIVAQAQVVLGRFALQADLFSLEDATYTARCANIQWVPTETLSAGMKIGAAVLPVAMAKKPGDNTRRLTFFSNDTDDTNAASWGAKDCLALLGMGTLYAQLPENLRAVMQTVSIRQLALVWDAKTNKLLDFTTELALLDGGTLQVMPKVSFSELSLQIQVDSRQTPKPDFTVCGLCKLGSVQIPGRVRLSSQQSSVLVQLAGKKRAVLGSPADLASLLGVQDLAAMAPQGIVAGKLYLENLLVRYNTAHAKLADFSLDIGIDSPFSLAAYLAINDIHLLYKRAGAEAAPHFSLQGRFTLGTLPFCVSADRKNGTWAYQGRTESGATANLGEFAGGLAQKVGLQLPPLPGIRLQYASVEYAAGALSVQADVSASFQKTDFLPLESLRGKLALTHGKNGAGLAGTVHGEAVIFSSLFTLDYQLSAKTSKLALAWQPASPLRITDFLRALGFGSLSIPAGLDLALQSAGMQYDFTSGLFCLTANTKQLGKLFFASMLVGKGDDKVRQYAFVLQADMKLKLSQLPVVGSSVPALEEVCLDGFGVQVATCDVADLSEYGYEKMEVKKGAVVQSTLAFFDYSLPLSIPFGGAKEQDALVATSAAPSVWFNVQKSAGPFQLRRIGAGYDDGALLFALDAAFENGGLLFELDGLTMAYSTKTHEIGLGLSGLSVALETDSFAVNGGFLRKSSHEYAGQLMLKLAGFSLCAVGAYTTRPAQSVFAFAYLKANLGGPPCFFVTGLAAGFAYNRSLEVPAIEQVSKFPLLAVLRDKDGIKPNQLMQDDQKYFPVDAGSHWLAAGIMFDSFKMVRSEAMLTVLFGKTVEINLLGHSVLDIPTGSSTPIAHAVLVLKASIQPKNNLASVEAVLTSESYILSKDCHLTGGFAFYTWYAGLYAGDFVLTLGGYSPYYKKPAHYPDVKRLGFSWQISDDLRASGGIYFALTPACLMAGGDLQILFTTRVVKAWFTAYVHLYMQWAPYHYDLRAGISIGVTVDLKLFSLDFELGCDLHIWGPDFSGSAKVKLWVISFTIHFGAGSPTSPPPLSWHDFTAAFLPEAKQNAAGGFACCSISAASGVLKERQTKSQTQWVVTSEELAITVKSVIPCTVLHLNGREIAKKPSIGVRPCAIASMDTTLEVTLVQIQRRGDKADGEAIETPVESGLVEAWGIEENAPSALWGKPGVPSETVPCITGLGLKMKPRESYTASFYIDVHYNNTPAVLANPAPIPPMRRPAGQAEKLLAGIQRQPNRSALLQAMGMGGAAVSLAGVAQNPGNVFVEMPVLQNHGGGTL